MINFQFPNFPHTKWDDNVETFEGVEGWYSDDIKEGWRVIYADGTWYDNAPKAPNKGIGDILTDLDARKKPVIFDKTLKGHAGFINYGNKAYQTLYTQDVFNTDKKLLFMGHSLGAALIIHVALLYQNYYDEKQIAIRLFGLPRPWGTGALCAYVRKHIKDYKSWSVGYEGTDWLRGISLLTGFKRPYSVIKLPSQAVFSGNLLDRVKQLITAMGSDHQPEAYRSSLTDDDVFATAQGEAL